MQGDGARRAGWEALLTMAASAEGSSFLFTGHSISLAHLRLSLMDRRAREVLTLLPLPRMGATFAAQAPLRTGASMLRAAATTQQRTLAKAPAWRTSAPPAAAPPVAERSPRLTPGARRAARQGVPAIRLRAAVGAGRGGAGRAAARPAGGRARVAAQPHSPRAAAAGRARAARRRPRGCARAARSRAHAGGVRVGGA